MYQDYCAAVIGTGFIGPVHVENVRRLGVRVKGILGSSEAKSIAAAGRMDLEQGYASLDALINDDEVNVVHVTSPNVFHYEQTIALLRAGKHVLCEKPLATSSQQTREMMQVAADSGLKTAVQYNIRFYPLNIEARARAGRFGRIFGISGGYTQDWLMYDTDYNWRVLSDRTGPTNALGDIGTHYLDLVQWVTGLKIEQVCADLRTIHATRKRPSGEQDAFTATQSKAQQLEEIAVDTDDFASVMLRFEGGVPGHLWTNQVTAGRKNRIYYEIAGDTGSLFWDGEDPNGLRIGARNEANRALIKDPANQAAEAAYFTGYPMGHAEGFGDSHKMCFKAFYDDLAGLNPPVKAPTLEEGHREVCLVEAILASNQQRAWVDVQY
jgi:predicted dehydrogenase